MSKRKISYQTKEKAKVTITLTGKVFLQFVDDEEAVQAAKGDMLVYPQNEALHTTRLGEYEATGFSGYFKVDISDGKNWQPLILSGVFVDDENHFGKKDRPIDVYNLCVEMLENLAGATVVRTYREHYELEEGE